MMMMVMMMMMMMNDGDVHDVDGDIVITYHELSKDG